ncbi:FxSxx-COOH system tetratricopeptide repeat protein [Geodermatophilus sp. URMC 60]
MSGRGTDFFISHAGRDTAWAEWLAWQLQQAGYTVELDVWDWAPGEDFVARMQQALQRADRLLAVCTPAYFASVFGGAELRAAFAAQADEPGRVVPVLVEPVTVPPLFAPLIRVDLTDLDEAAAAARLRDRLAGGRPTRPPPFPRSDASPGGGVGGRPGFAGTLPGVWQVPPRNPHFTGRDGLLAGIRRRLRAQKGTPAVQALYGLGGVGKTQLALEYAHRYAADYELVWWIDAEQPVLIANQLAAFAARLDLPAGATVAATVDRLLAELRRRDRWLLVFDNAERPADVADYRPAGAGHLLITSRFPGWGALGGRIEVDVLARSETVALLRARLPDLDGELADKLAGELGDLPLAAAQAAAYLEQTALPAADYLRRFRKHRASLLARGEVLGYAGRLDTAWTLSLERLRHRDLAAVQLLQLAAFLAPGPIPLSLFGEHAELLEEPLRTTATDLDALADTVGALVGYSLARRTPDGFQVHRLVQAVIRQRLPPEEQQATVEQVVRLLAAATCGDPHDPRTWPAYAALASHVLATGPHADRSSAGREMVLAVTSYLQDRGDSRASRATCQQLLERWRPSLGPDHPDTLTAASTLTLALVQLGETEAGRALAEDTLQRSRRVFGPDHPTTLIVATILPLALVELGDTEAGRAVAEDTLQGSRRVFGPDHPTTLLAAASLAASLLLLGEAESARALAEDTLARSHSVLGPYRQTTLMAAAILAGARVLLGQAEPARALAEDTLQRARRAFGPDHPLTLEAAAILAGALMLLGKAEPARALAEDTLQRSRRVLGQDNPIILMAAAALAGALMLLGKAEPARALAEDTLQRSRRVFGPSHPFTLTLAHASIGHLDRGDDAAADRLRRSP